MQSALVLYQVFIRNLETAYPQSLACKLACCSKALKLRKCPSEGRVIEPLSIDNCEDEEDNDDVDNTDPRQDTTGDEIGSSSSVSIQFRESLLLKARLSIRSIIELKEYTLKASNHRAKCLHA